MLPKAAGTSSEAPTFGEYQQRAELGYAQLLLRIFDETEEIGEDTKRGVRESVESSVHAVAPFLGRREALAVLETRMLAALADRLPLLFSLVAVFFLFTDRSELSAATGIIAGLLSIAAAVGGVLAALKLIEGLMWLFRTLWGLQAPRLPAYALTAVTFLGIAIILSSPPGPSWLVPALRTAFWATGLFVASFLVLAQSLHLSRVLARLMTIRKVPAAEVMAQILLTLDVAKTAPEREAGTPAASPGRFQVIGPDGTTQGGVAAAGGLMQQLADTIERALPVLLADVPDAGRWVKQEARSIGGALERARRDLLLSGTTRLEAVRSRMATMLIHVADGNWGSLERGDPESRVARMGLLDLSRAVILGGLPLVVGLALRLEILSVDVAEGVVDGIFRFGIGWAVYHSLLMLNAQIVKRLGGANTVLTTIGSAH